MTTSEPSLAEEISKLAAAQGKFALDAPVSGGDIGAREARLSIMIGGGADVAKAVDPLFKLMVRSATSLPPATFACIDLSKTPSAPC